MVKELNEDRYSAYVVTAIELSKLFNVTNLVDIRCDSTNNRRSRANSINALKRAIERHYNVTLTKRFVNYSETYGFLSRTEVRYQVTKN